MVASNQPTPTIPSQLRSRMLRSANSQFERSKEKRNSYNTVSRTGDQYSRSGDVTRTTGGSAGIKSTSGSNYTTLGGLTFHWTVSTSGVETSQDFSLDGNSTNTNDSSVLAGEVTTSNTTTVGGSDTVGQRTENTAPQKYQRILASISGKKSRPSNTQPPAKNIRRILTSKMR